jgi:hypothetical protein
MVKSINYTLRYCYHTCKAQATISIVRKIHIGKNAYGTASFVAIKSQDVLD